MRYAWISTRTPGYANFDELLRQLRNYFYWEPHCFDTPIGWALRSLFDALDGINQLTDQLDNVSAASPSSMSCRQAYADFGRGSGHRAGPAVMDNGPIHLSDFAVHPLKSL